MYTHNSVVKKIMGSRLFTPTGSVANVLRPLHDFGIMHASEEGKCLFPVARLWCPMTRPQDGVKGVVYPPSHSGSNAMFSSSTSGGFDATKSEGTSDGSGSGKMSLLDAVEFAGIPRPTATLRGIAGQSSSVFTGLAGVCSSGFRIRGGGVLSYGLSMNRLRWPRPDIASQISFKLRLSIADGRKKRTLRRCTMRCTVKKK